MGNKGSPSGKSGAGAKTMSAMDMKSEILNKYEDPRGVIPYGVSVAVEKAVNSGNKYMEDAYQLENEAKQLRKERSATVSRLARAEVDLGKRDPETKILQKRADAQMAEIKNLESSAKSLRKQADAEYDRARAKLKPYQK